MADRYENPAETAAWESMKTPMSDTPPFAEMTQMGRWLWCVYVRNGMGRWGPDGRGWYVLGRKRAARKARKVLARYIRKQQRQDNPIRVYAEESTDA